MAKAVSSPLLAVIGVGAPGRFAPAGAVADLGAAAETAGAAAAEVRKAAGTVGEAPMTDPGRVPP